jgi:hypothetical protein
MLFGLKKNTRATYKQEIVTLFRDIIHKEIKVFMDDIITTSKQKEDHVKILKKLIESIN